MANAFTPTMLVTEGWDGYALLDSGAGRKLERFGAVVLDRPEPQAMWAPRLDGRAWDAADAVFTGEGEDAAGRWRFRGKPFETWPASWRRLDFLGRITSFRHAGFFPEQSLHWEWMLDRLGERPQPRLLNLFGYTGVASLLAARAGAQVTHVDASKKAIGWARENVAAARMEGAAIRWIVEDAREFAQRELRRGRAYDGILLDPPKYGRGPKGEVWDLFPDLPAMLECCRALLAEGGFLILTAYAVRASFVSFDQLCADIFGAASRESGELIVREQGGGRLLSTSMFTRVVR